MKIVIEKILNNGYFLIKPRILYYSLRTSYTSVKLSHIYDCEQFYHSLTTMIGREKIFFVTSDHSKYKLLNHVKCLWTIQSLVFRVCFQLLFIFV